LRFIGIGAAPRYLFPADAMAGHLSDLELRHCRRAQCEDRIRDAAATGLCRLPLHGFARDQIW
jgi:hypothetical protein